MEVLDRAREYFVVKNGLTLVESFAHYHGQSGSIDVGVSGVKLMGKTEYDSKTVLNELMKYVEEQFGIKLETLILHLHSSLGHIELVVSNSKPVEVTIETMEHENEVSEFLHKLP